MAQIRRHQEAAQDEIDQVKITTPVPEAGPAQKPVLYDKLKPDHGGHGQKIKIYAFVNNTVKNTFLFVQFMLIFLFVFSLTAVPRTAVKIIFPDFF